MSRLTDIETEISNVLLTIDGTSQGTYEYKTDTGTVQVYDQVYSIRQNTGSINHIVEQEENVGVENLTIEDTDWGQNVYSQRCIYVITTKVSAIQVGANPINAIRDKMNDIFDDLLFAFGKNFTLNKSVDYIKFISSFRDYENITNNRIQTGELITMWDIEFTQRVNNPSIQGCG